MSFDVTDLAGMPEGPTPNRDLVSSWSIESMTRHLNALDRTSANGVTREAVRLHESGKDPHTVFPWLISAENKAVSSERGWYAARVDAYAALHGIRGWYRAIGHDGRPTVQRNLLRGPDAGERGRFYVHAANPTAWGTERLLRFWVVDRDTGKTAYRACTSGIARQWIEIRENESPVGS